MEAIRCSEKSKVSSKMTLLQPSKLGFIIAVKTSKL
jgi:hypothetical protein